MTDESDAADTGGMRIEADLVRQLAELLNQNELTEIEVVDGGRRIVVKREVQVTHAAPAAQAAAPAPAPAAAAPAPAPAPAADVPPSAHPGAVKSPMVGTVYLAAQPGAEPFVKPGDRVSEGQTLLIVEAMKTMNPIPSPRAGTVVELLVADGQPVEFGESLLVLE